MNNNEIMEELKGYKKFRKSLLILFSLSIVVAIIGIVTCILKGSVEVWQHVVLWIDLIMSDVLILTIFKCVKNLSIVKEVDIEELNDEG